MPQTRTEHDSMGPVQLPAEAYYGAQTQRAVHQFPHFWKDSSAGDDPRHGARQVGCGEGEPGIGGG